MGDLSSDIKRFQIEHLESKFVNDTCSVNYQAKIEFQHTLNIMKAQIFLHDQLKIFASSRVRAAASVSLKLKVPTKKYQSLKSQLEAKFDEKLKDGKIKSINDIEVR